MRSLQFVGKRGIGLVFLVAALGACRSAMVTREETFPSRQDGGGPIAWEPMDGNSSFASRAEPGVVRDVETLRLHVDGMTCPVRCPRQIRAMLAGVPGLLNVSVDVPSQTVIANVERGTDPQSLVDAIKSPYRARLL